MKKIICKVEYDTENAVLVEKRTYGELGDPQGYEECLYQKEYLKQFLWFNFSHISLFTNRIYQIFRSP